MRRNFLVFIILLVCDLTYSQHDKRSNYKEIINLIVNEFGKNKENIIYYKFINEDIISDLKFIYYKNLSDDSNNHDSINFKGYIFNYENSYKQLSLKKVKKHFL